MNRTPRVTTVLVAGFVALNAIAGGFGFLGGGIDMGSTITGRFPLHSPVLAGIALLAVVDVPMTAAVVLALRRDRRWSVAAMAAGLVLVGWIVVQVAVIRTFSWMQPASVVAGVVVFVAGWRGRNASDVPVQRGPLPASARRPRRDA
ncbi:hypothetical protein IOD16_18420 [Saccharothrix sp. 6-C]|uniref:hypothetical protein n=1 Tax=Saccharothrix sp. 6-C TaxID=2781735 RepID=UPI001917459B|nr:hypothetical protein [Saccharothrix sp. 6-C]QQQ80182.1 hypothetical protein IOD16_18420 [Saccharothrix sp. 6-C]